MALSEKEKQHFIELSEAERAEFIGKIENLKKTQQYINLIPNTTQYMSKENFMDLDNTEKQIYIGTLPNNIAAKYTELIPESNVGKDMYKTRQQAIDLGLAEECVNPTYINIFGDKKKKININVARYFVSNGLNEYLDMMMPGGKLTENNKILKFYLNLIFQSIDNEYKLCFINSSGDGYCFFNSLYIFLTTIKNPEFNQLTESLKDTKKFKFSYVEQHIRNHSGIYNELGEEAENIKAQLMRNNVPLIEIFTDLLKKKYNIKIYIITKNNKGSFDITKTGPSDNSMTEDYIFLINPCGVHYHTVIPFIKDTTTTNKEIRKKLAHKLDIIISKLNTEYRKNAFLRAALNYNGKTEINTNSIIARANNLNSKHISVAQNMINQINQEISEKKSPENILETLKTKFHKYFKERLTEDETKLNTSTTKKTLEKIAHKKENIKASDIIPLLQYKLIPYLYNKLPTLAKNNTSIPMGLQKETQNQSQESENIKITPTPTPISLQTQHSNHTKLSKPIKSVHTYHTIDISKVHNNLDTYRNFMTRFTLKVI